MVRGRLAVTFLALLYLSGLTSPVAAETQQDRVIYGEDNRLDVFEAAELPRLQKAARSTAVLMQKDLFVDQDAVIKDAEEIDLTAPTLADAMHLCPEERFGEQPTLGYCSSFLVAPNIMVTAGHCIKNQFDCDGAAFVFDYAYYEEGADPTAVKTDNVYFCKRVIKTMLDPRSRADFSVVELDRSVRGRAPLKFRKSGQVSSDAELGIIGNPSGLPTKIANGASIRVNQAAAYFDANTDSYQGNSGSAVFNDRSGVIEGILVRGEDDFVRDQERGCLRSKICETDGCRGESVTRATEFAPFVK